MPIVMVSDIVTFSTNLGTKCVFLVIFRHPPYPPPLVSIVCISCDPQPPLAAYVINGSPHNNL